MKHINNVSFLGGIRLEECVYVCVCKSHDAKVERTAKVSDIVDRSGHDK